MTEAIETSVKIRESRARRAFKLAGYMILRENIIQYGEQHADSVKLADVDAVIARIQAEERA